jgi:hypothetical protein
MCSPFIALNACRGDLLSGPFTRDRQPLQHNVLTDFHLMRSWALTGCNIYRILSNGKL